MFPFLRNGYPTDPQKSYLATGTNSRDKLFPEPRDGLLGVGEGGLQTFEQLRRTFGFEIVTAAAGSHETAPETVAANQRREVEKVATNFPARFTKTESSLTSLILNKSAV